MAIPAAPVTDPQLRAPKIPRAVPAVPLGKAIPWLWEQGAPAEGRAGLQTGAEPLLSLLVSALPMSVSLLIPRKCHILFFPLSKACLCFPPPPTPPLFPTPLFTVGQPQLLGSPFTRRLGT